MRWSGAATPGRQSQTRWQTFTRQCGGREVRTRRPLFVAFGLPLLWTAPILAGKGFSMSNAIIKQQGDSPVVADNIWDIQLGAGSFILGALTGALVTAAVGRLAAKGDALPKPPTPRGWPINFAHRGGAKVIPENTIEGFPRRICLMRRGRGMRRTRIR